MWRIRSLIFRLTAFSVGLLLIGLMVSVIAVAAEIELWLRLSLLCSFTTLLAAVAVIGIYRLMRPLSGFLHALRIDRQNAENFDVESCEEMELLKSLLKKHEQKTEKVLESIRLELNFLQSQAVRLGDGFASLNNRLQETIEYNRTNGVQFNTMIGGFADNERVSSTLVTSYAEQTKNLDRSSDEIRQATRIFEEAKKSQLGRIDRLKQLMVDFEEIDEAIRRIHLISDQTKIVAFNAGIEASASGDIGRRFGVVAGDIRSLAHNVERINRDIRGIVERLRDGLSAIAQSASDDALRVEKVLERVRLVSNDLSRASAASLPFSGQPVPFESLQSFWYAHRDENARQNTDLASLSEKFSTQLEEFENRLNRFTYQVNGTVL